MLLFMQLNHPAHHALSRTDVPLFPGLLHLLTCSMQKRKEKAWGILLHDPQHNHHMCKRLKAGGVGARVGQVWLYTVHGQLKTQYGTSRAHDDIIVTAAITMMSSLLLQYRWCHCYCSNNDDVIVTAALTMMSSCALGNLHGQTVYGQLNTWL